MITSHAIKAFSYWLLHSSARQVAPLQRRVAKILNGIEADRKQAKSETSTDWFKRANGKWVAKDAIARTLKRACRDAKVKNFRAMISGIARNRLARKTIPGESAKLAAGHSFSSCTNV